MTDVFTEFEVTRPMCFIKVIGQRFDHYGHCDVDLWAGEQNQ